MKKTLLLLFSQRLNPNISETYFVTVILKQNRTRFRPFRPAGAGFILKLGIIVD
jgi:hypothetical protein